MLKMFSTMTLFGVLTVSAAYAQSNKPAQAKVVLASTVEDVELAALNDRSLGVSYDLPACAGRLCPI